MGGITAACNEVAGAWYEGAIQTVHRVSSAEAAEMAKLLENTFRMINIGLVNELAIMCERLGVDVWEVIDAAATDLSVHEIHARTRAGRALYPDRPAVSVLEDEVLPLQRVSSSWPEINTNMPRYVVSRVMEALNDRGKPLKGSKVLVLGAATNRTSMMSRIWRWM